MTDAAIGIIGGSGLYEMEGLQVVEERRVKTPFGEPSDPYIVGQIDGIGSLFSRATDADTAGCPVS